MPMVSSVLLGLSASLFFSWAIAKCQTSFAVHEAINAPNNILRFDDGGSFRELKAKAYNINNCVAYPSLPTGQQFYGNYSVMGYEAATSNGDCLIKRVNGESIYDSMQAIVITTNGWTLEAPAINLDDIDAQFNVESTRGWKESLALFGLLNGALVEPDLTFSGDTLLANNTYKVPSAAMAEMGLSLGDTYVSGSEYAATEMVNCPAGRENEEARKCRMTAQFPSPVDTLVLLYAVVQKSADDPNALMFVSEVLMGCGCRCEQRNDGAHKVTDLVSGVPGMCTQSMSTSPATECDVMGTKWCSKDDMVSYVVTGEQQANGNFPCSEKTGLKVKVLGDFSPRSDFATSP